MSYCDKCAKLEAEVSRLTADLPRVENVEVAAMSRQLRTARNLEPNLAAADLLSRLSSALASAERDLVNVRKAMQEWIDHHYDRAETAEAKLREARAALGSIDSHNDNPARYDQHIDGIIRAALKE